MLVLSGRPCTLLLHVGKQWLDERGVLSEGVSRCRPWPAMRSVPTATRSRFMPDTRSLALVLLWQARQWAIMVLFGLCFGFALLIWWLLGRPRSPVVELARALRNREFVPYLQPLVAAGE